MKYETNEKNIIKYHNAVFEVTDIKTGNEFLYKSLLSLHKSFVPDDFEMYFLYNNNDGVSENSIFNLYADGIRIGWIFPIQSLESQEHDYVHNEFYLKYAYIVVYKLLQMAEFGDREYSEFSILDYYSDDIQILVYDKGNASEIESFDISNYAVDLFSKGYSFCGEGNVFTKLDAVDQNIRIKQLPKQIRDISYINVLFMELIPLRDSSYSKFHLIYQIIEILIGVVFNYKFKSFIQEIEDSPDDLFEKREKLSGITTEKDRVIWLFENFSSVELQKREILNSFCEKMLQDNEKKYKENNVGNNLYAVRCLIVHNLYSLDEDSRELLKELNNSFLDVVLDILFTFHES